MASGIVRIKLKLEGAKQAIRLLENFAKSAPDRLEKELNWYSKRVEGKAQSLAPVDTGRLKSSIKWMYEAKLIRIIEADVRYAPYVEFGIGRGFQTMPYLYDYAATFKRGRRRDIGPKRFLFLAKEQHEEELFKRAFNAIRWRK
jgi:hypothetical protein